LVSERHFSREVWWKPKCLYMRRNSFPLWWRSMRRSSSKSFVSALDVVNGSELTDGRELVPKMLAEAEVVFPIESGRLGVASSFNRILDLVKSPSYKAHPDCSLFQFFHYLIYYYHFIIILLSFYYHFIIILLSFYYHFIIILLSFYYHIIVCTC
jgi:hypothetical protein